MVKYPLPLLIIQGTSNTNNLYAEVLSVRGKIIHEHLCRRPHNP